jgi:phosphocarrier protein FPr
MVGLVIVSHSKPLAEALVNLVKQVSQDQIPIAYAAGVGEGRLEFGTDAIEISEAIQSVFSEDGVLVLMDLGSAILSAELAVELLPPEMAEKIRFCAAPVVEGAIAAGVQASLGSDLDTVCNEARQALLPKAEQLGQADVVGAQPSVQEVTVIVDPGQTIVVPLMNEHGLHARPAARFVQLAGSFDAEIQVQNLTAEKGPVSAKSLNALATLGAVHGHQIMIAARGPQSNQALEALKTLVEDNFGEEVHVEGDTTILAPTPELASAGGMRAVPVSDGIALGPVYHFKPPPPPVPDYPAEDPEVEWGRYQRALASTREAIRSRRQQVQASLGENQAAIFDAHLLILEDPELQEKVRVRVFQENTNGPQAWNQSIQEVAASYRALDNPYLQQRAIDVEDVGNQLLNVLAGSPATETIKFDKPVILVAPDLTPTQTAQLDLSQILGLATVGGGPTSHSAILARALGIPGIAGVDASISTLPPETLLGINGFNGTLWVNPPQETQDQLKSAREEWFAQKQALLKYTHEPATTKDGYQIEVAANAGNVHDAEAAVKNGAEGIGLLRTEFLFLTRASPPDEEEQTETLRKIGEAVGDRPVIVRTLDVGGDKYLPYIDLPAEANPFLGVRAIRLSLQNQDLFLTQLRAILRAGHGHNFRIMFPMVTSIGEITAATALLADAHEALDTEGIAHQWPIETGIMIETPAAALLSSILAKHVDFFSVGTNDLTQYTLAADRGNPKLSHFADALNPAVLRLIKIVVTAAQQHGKWVGVCGELAGDPIAVPVLLGLGVNELSLNPGGIPKVKSIIRKIDHSSAVQIAEEVLQKGDAVSARQLAASFLEDIEKNNEE